MYSPRKIALLKIMGRPFLEAPSKDIAHTLIDAAFAQGLINSETPLPEPFNDVEDPDRFLDKMQTDLIQELISRN